MQIVFMKSAEPKGIDFLAKLARTEVTAFGLMKLPENTEVPTRTCAAKPLGGFKKGDAAKAFRVHWHGSLGKLSMLPIGNNNERLA